jgi:hypothetical protein
LSVLLRRSVRKFRRSSSRLDFRHFGAGAAMS